jgi:hypothetical protein
MKLDISKKYQYQDRSECFWRFTFESIAGEEGWFAWLRRPNSEEYFCVGMLNEKDLMQRLNENPPPLGIDDLIDLEMWLIHNGLKEYEPKQGENK